MVKIVHSANVVPHLFYLCCIFSLFWIDRFILIYEPTVNFDYFWILNAIYGDHMWFMYWNWCNILFLSFILSGRSNDSSPSAELSSARSKEDARPGHKRSVSVGADIGSSCMSFRNEQERVAEESPTGPHKGPLQNIVKACWLSSALKPKHAIKYKKRSYEVRTGRQTWCWKGNPSHTKKSLLTNSQLGQVIGILLEWCNTIRFEA